MFRRLSAGATCGEVEGRHIGAEGHPTGIFPAVQRILVEKNRNVDYTRVGLL